MNSCKSVSKLNRKWIGYAIQHPKGFPGECVLCFNSQSGSETSVWDVFFEVKDGEKSAGGSCSSFWSCFLLLETMCGFFFSPSALDLMSKTLSGSCLKKGLLFNAMYVHHQHVQMCTCWLGLDTWTTRLGLGEDPDVDFSGRLYDTGGVHSELKLESYSLINLTRREWKWAATRVS